jgi:sulfur relay (sulfurtransferase) complex TusBCD TusD component (DsrE family)
MQFSTLLFTLSLLSSTAFAHPGSHDGHDVAKRTQFLGNAKRSIADCSDALKARGIESGAIARREALANSLREKRAIKKRGEFLKARDVDTVLSTDHHSNTTGLTSSSDSSVLFTGDLKCVLQPETTQGPYCEYFPPTILD